MEGLERLARRRVKSIGMVRPARARLQTSCALQALDAASCLRSGSVPAPAGGYAWLDTTLITRTRTSIHMWRMWPRLPPAALGAVVGSLSATLMPTCAGELGLQGARIWTNMRARSQIHRQ